MFLFGPSRKPARRGSSAPEEWSAPYAGAAADGGKRKRLFRELQQESIIELGMLSEKECEKKCEEYCLIPPLSGRTCHVCGSKMELKQWKDRQNLV